MSNILTTPIEFTPEEKADLLDIVLHHVNARQYLIDMFNGTNTWLFEMASDYTITTDQARQLCSSFGQKIIEYLQMAYRIENRNGFTTESWNQFFATNEAVTIAGMSYIINTFQSRDKENVLFFLIALLIGLNRDEQVFEEFRKNMPLVDIGTALAMFVKFKRHQGF